MKSLSLLCLAAALAVAAVGPARAQQKSLSPPSSDAAVPDALSQSQRLAIAEELIAKWQGDVRARPSGDVARWSVKLKAAVAQADAANVLRASTMTSLETMHAALNGMIQGGAAQSSSMIGNATVASQSLGSLLSDTTSPLPNGRCRVANSRTIASPIAGGSTRTLIVDETADYASQGGNGTYANGTGSANCGIPANAVAYAVSVTLLSPTASGIFKVYRSGDPYQTGNSILFNAGDYGSNGDLIVRNCQYCASEISIQSSAGTVHYVIDVVGFFHAPQATELECFNTPYNTYTINPNSSGSWAGQACAAGYTSTSTSCFAGDSTFKLHGQGRSFCYGDTMGAPSSVSLSISQVCCRVPGR